MPLLAYFWTPLMNLFARYLLTLLSILLSVYQLQAQSGKAFLKEAEEYRKQQDLDKAVERYTLAIQIDPRLVKAYQGRAEVYELMGRKAECARDRRILADLNPDEPSFATMAAVAYLELDSASVARELCDRALRVDPRS